MDRDHTWHRKDPSFDGSPSALPFTRPATTRQDTLWMVLVWITVAFALYKGIVWLGDWRASQAAKSNANFGQVVNQVSKPQVATPNSPPLTFRSERPSAPASPFGDSTNKRSVTKCVLNGAVMFTDGDCPVGAKRIAVSVDVSNVGTVVPKVSSTNPELAVQTHRNDLQQQPVQNVMSTPSKSQIRAAECPYLKLRIEQIDAATRQPLQFQEQERYKEERRKVRQREYDLGC